MLVNVLRFIGLKECLYKLLWNAVIHVCKVSSVILKGVKRGTLYLVQGTTLTDSVVVASSEIDQEDMMKLWHMSERGMQILAKGGLLCGNKIRILGSMNIVFLENYIATRFLKRFI